MSRKNGSPAGKRRENTANRWGGDFKGFVDLPLTGDCRDRIAQAKAEGAIDWLAFFDQVLQDGYKFSLAYNSSLRSFIATLTGRDGSGANEGYALSGFGGTAEDSLLALWGKHCLISNWGAWVQAADSSTDQLPLWR